MKQESAINIHEESNFNWNIQANSYNSPDNDNSFRRNYNNNINEISNTSLRKNEYGTNNNNYTQQNKSIDQYSSTITKNELSFTKFSD